MAAIKEILDDVESTDSFIADLKHAVDQITPMLTRFSCQEVFYHIKLALEDLRDACTRIAKHATNWRERNCVKKISRTPR